MGSEIQLVQLGRISNFGPCTTRMLLWC